MYYNYLILLVILIFIKYILNTSYTELFFDDSLRYYLANKDNGKGLQNYQYGFKKEGEPCSIEDSEKSKFGVTWRAVYKDDVKDFCIPESINRNKMFIPCSASKPGLPDIKECGKPNKKCLEEMNKIKKNFKRYQKEKGLTEDQIQQYIYVCSKKCLCSHKYGKDFGKNIYDCSPLKPITPDNKLPFSPNKLPFSPNKLPFSSKELNNKCKKAQHGCCSDGTLAIDKYKSNCSEKSSYDSNIIYTKCNSLPKENVNKTKYYQKICENDVAKSSVFVQPSSVGCVQPYYARAGCVLESPAFL